MQQVAKEAQDADAMLMQAVAAYRDAPQYQLQVTGAIIVRFETITRNKRCALAYLNERMNKLKDVWWEAGRILPEEIKTCLSQHEIDVFSRYDDIMGKYMRECGVNLIADQQPPKSLHIEVAVKEDCGEVLTEHGPVILKKNTRHLIRRSDCELLIKQGMLEQVGPTLQ